MLEKIKEVPFIDESRAVKLISRDGKLVLERNDRVVWAYEKTAIPADASINCYVEADKFFALISEIKSLTQGTCLTVELKNGAKYELPLLTVQWEPEAMPTEYPDKITFSISDLMLCTLSNLIKPELQCIYIDSEGAVTCNYVTACVNDKVKSSVPFLLPPAVLPLVEGRLCNVAVKGSRVFIENAEFGVVTTAGVHIKDEGEEETGAWWAQLRGAFASVPGYAKTEPLIEGMKRLALFDKFVSFDGNKVTAGSNFEPFMFADLGTNKYEIASLSKILAVSAGIGEAEGNLVLKNDNSRFLVSPIDEA